ncbi:MAG: amino acid adenylation domain-containing protein [Symploca sp. SIO3C6]|nr:amino acid adenylation domain-containing protein [Symploca sp. SIO3C6]
MDLQKKEKIVARRSKLSPAQQMLLQKRLRSEIKSDSKLNIIPRRSSTSPAPLSFSQQRLWFLQQLEPSSAFYNEHGSIQLTGFLNVAALEQSINEIVRRHESLRTTFEMMEGQPVQIIAPNLSLTLPVIDLQDLPEAEQKTEVKLLETKQIQQPFDLIQGPLLRWMLLQLGKQKHILLFTVHHIVFDGWSVGVMFRELSDFYQAFSTGKPASLPELPIQYADFALWQQQDLHKEKLQSQLSYWKQQLANAPTMLQLSTDRPRPPVQSHRGAKQTFLLPKSLTVALQAIGKKAETTLFITLLSAFKILLYRYTGQEDIVVGSGIVNRNRAEIEGLIGCFVNSLVLRTDLSNNPTFEELLGRVRTVTMGAYAHKDLPFGKLVEELRQERDANYNPLFQVSFALQNNPKGKFELPGLTITFLEVERTKAVLDLRLDITETDEGLECFWEYSTDLFDAATIIRMSGHFQTLLEAIAVNPQQRISQLPILTEAEEQQLLSEWNQTQVPYPKDICIHQLFEAQVEKTPDAVAVVFEDQQLTYRELNQQANQLAHYLKKLGAKPEVLVGICVERSLEMIIGLLGILKAGGAFVPIDPAYTQEDLAYMLSDSQVSLLLTTKELGAKLPEHQANVVEIDTDWEIIHEESRENPLTDLNSENLAYVIYASESAEKPKGVLTIHKGLCNLVEAQISLFDVKPESRVLLFFSLSFDVSIGEIFTTFSSGATLYLGKPESFLSGSALMQLLREYAINHVSLLPSALRLLLHEELPSLRTIIVSGENCSSELVTFWSKDRKLFNVYGSTEATICTAVAECDHGSQKLGICRPIANKQLYILDSNLQTVPIGIPGELYIGGIGLARGYLNCPELTSQKFIFNPFSDEPGARLYKTGDLCRYLPNGNIEYLGSIDHQVRIRGLRIELTEIEAALAKHPAIKEVVVIVREEDSDDKQLVAYLVQNQELNLTISELQNFLKEKLPIYMMPSVFVVLEALPLTLNGKVDKRTLPAPENCLQLKEAYVMPQTEAERLIATVWQEMLQLEKVGINDNFFSLGGYSLLLVKTQAKLNEIFSKEISVLELFQYTTIKSLAQYLNNKTDVEKNKKTTSRNIQNRASKQKEALKKQKQLLKQRGGKANG